MQHSAVTQGPALNCGFHAGSQLFEFWRLIVSIERVARPHREFCLHTGGGATMRGSWYETFTSVLLAAFTVAVLHVYFQFRTNPITNIPAPPAAHIVEPSARAAHGTAIPSTQPTIAVATTLVPALEIQPRVGPEVLANETASGDASGPPHSGDSAVLSEKQREWAYQVSDEEGAKENSIWHNISSAECPVDFGLPVSIQLAPFQQDGITQSMLDGLYCVRKHVARVSIDRDGAIRQENWQLSLDHNRLRSGMWLLQLAVRRAAILGRPIPPVELLLNPTDKTADFASGKKKNSPEALRLRQSPLFCNAKCTGDHSISFPMYLHPLYGLPDGQMGLERCVAWPDRITRCAAPPPTPQM